MSPRAEAVLMLLRQYPDAGVEAIAAYRVTTRWERQEGDEPLWFRYPRLDGELLEHRECPLYDAEMDREPLGHICPVEVDDGEVPRWEAFVDDVSIGTFEMLPLAQHAIDARLRGAGWCTP